MFASVSTPAGVFALPPPVYDPMESRRNREGLRKALVNVGVAEALDRALAADDMAGATEALRTLIALAPRASWFHPHYDLRDCKQCRRPFVAPRDAAHAGTWICSDDCRRERNAAKCRAFRAALTAEPPAYTSPLALALALRECAQCGRQFAPPAGRRYSRLRICSDDCRRERERERGRRRRAG